MKYQCIKLISLIVRWLLPIKLLTISTNNHEYTNNNSNQSNTLQKIVRDSLTVITYRELTTTPMLVETTTTCTVCLSEVEGKDRVWQLRNCNHVFHKKCLDTWLDHDEHMTCPLCRAPLMARPLAQPSMVAPTAEPSWAVERLLYWFGDDLMF